MTQVAEQYDILEKAIVTVFDLEMKVKDKGFGGSRIVAETAAYGSQLGAQVQWGATDEQLIYNSYNDTAGMALGVVHNIFTDERLILDCTVYHVSPSGKFAASPNLLDLQHLQVGYGFDKKLPSDVTRRMKESDSGFVLADLETGRCRTLLDPTVIRQSLEVESNTVIKGFHVKWAPQSFGASESIIFIVRQVGNFTESTRDFYDIHAGRTQHRVSHMLAATLSSDPKNSLSVTSVTRLHSWSSTLHRWMGMPIGDGNHPNWCAAKYDAQQSSWLWHITMNTRPPSERAPPRHARRLYGDVGLWDLTLFTVNVQLDGTSQDGVRSDGEGMDSPLVAVAATVESEVLLPDRSSGHPIVTPDLRYAILDATLKEHHNFDGDAVGSTGLGHDHKYKLPLRQVDLRTGEERVLAQLDLGEPSFRDTEYYRALSWPWALLNEFVTDTVARWLYGVPWRSTYHKRQMVAWRCDAHPTFYFNKRDPRHLHLAVNVRQPSTRNRAVALIPLPIEW